MSDMAGSRSEAFVDQLLNEAELDHDGQLRPALLQLRALRAEAPEPSAEVAALLKQARTTTPPRTLVQAVVENPASAAEKPAPTDDLAGRRRAKRRTALTALSVAVSLGAGVAVAAASDEGFRNSLNQAVSSFVTGTGGSSAPGPEPEPAVTVPSIPAGPAAVPAAPAPAGQTAEAQAPDVPATQAPGGNSAKPEQPAAGIPVPGLPTAVPDLSNGGGQQPQVPVPGPSDLPLPGTLPADPLR